MTEPKKRGKKIDGNEEINKLAGTQEKRRRKKTIPNENKPKPTKKCEKNDLLKIRIRNSPAGHHNKFACSF